MKKATTLKEVYNIFDLQRPLTPEEKGFYVELYHETLEEMRTKLDFNEDPKKTFYVTGQVGNGKSTMLNFLAEDSEEIANKYEIVHIGGRDVFKQNDTDIVDVLLYVGFTLVELDKDRGGKLEEGIAEKLTKFKEKFEELLNVEEQEVVKVGKSADISFFAKAKATLLPFSFGVDAKGRYNLEKETKEITRKIFKPKISDLIELVNEVVARYAKAHMKSKELLLIIDDLEKMTEKEQVKELFRDYGYVFPKIECVKIVTFPIYLTTVVDYLNDESYKFSVRITTNRLDENPKDEDESSAKTKENLRNVVLNRLEDSALIADDALKLAIEKSGANVRQLFEILQKSAIHAHTKKLAAVNKLSIEKAIEDMQNARSGAIHKIVEVLAYIKNNSIPPKDDDEEFFESLKANYIFKYFNGNPWYEINPIVENILRKYAKVQNIEIK